MKIEVYKNTSTILEKLLPSLIDAQIECWGSKPFDEYKICENEECRALFSIEDIHGSIKKFNKNNGESIDFKCEYCFSKTEFVYEKEKFLEDAKEYISGKVSLILLVNNSVIKGFGVITEKTLRELLNLELGNRPKSYNNNLLKESELVINLDEVFFCINHIFVAEKYRGKGYGKKILYEIFKILREKQHQIITETRYDSDFYSICRSIGFEGIINDKYGYILMLLEEKGFLNEESINSIFNNISKDFLKYKNEALAILELNIGFSGRKNYV